MKKVFRKHELLMVAGVACMVTVPHSTAFAQANFPTGHLSEAIQCCGLEKI